MWVHKDEGDTTSVLHHSSAVIGSSLVISGLFTAWKEGGAANMGAAAI